MKTFIVTAEPYKTKLPIPRAQELNDPSFALSPIHPLMRLGCASSGVEVAEASSHEMGEEGVELS